MAIPSCRVSSISLPGCVRTLLLACAVMSASALHAQPSLLLSNPELIAAAPVGRQLAVYDRPDLTILSGDIIIMDTLGSVLNRITNAQLRARGVMRVTTITFDPSDVLHILDASTKTVFRWSVGGAFLSSVTLPIPGPTILLRGLAVGLGGQLFVTDAPSGVLYSCGTGASCTGMPVAGSGVPAGAQDRAGAVAISPDLSKLYVGLPSASRVARLSLTATGLVWGGVVGACRAGLDCEVLPASMAGVTRKWCMIDTNCVLTRPTDSVGRIVVVPSYLGAASDGRLIVADLAATGALHMFDSSGARLRFVAPRGRGIGESGNFAFAVEADGGVTVAEVTLHRVSRFAPGSGVRGVIGGTVELSSSEGRTDVTRVRIGDLLPRKIGMAAVATGNYVGPVSLSAPSCLFAGHVPPFRACSSYGITATLASPTIAVPPGTAGLDTLTVTVTRPTLSGKYLVATGAAAPFTDAFLQVGITVDLPPKVILSPATQTITLFPGDPPATVSHELQTFAVSGVARFTGAWTPPPAAGQLNFSFSPASASVSGTAVTPLTTSITAQPTARSGLRVLRITGRVGSGSAAPSDSASVDVVVACACTRTGGFVEPVVVPVVGSGLSALSPSGRWRVVTTPGSISGTSATVRIENASNGAVLVGPFNNPTSWGFSPDASERYVMVTTPGPAGVGANDVNVDVFDLSAGGQRVFAHTVPGCLPADPVCVPPPKFCFSTQSKSCLGSGGNASGPRFGLAQWGFSPDGRMFMIASINVRVSNAPLVVRVHDLTRGLGSAAVVSTEVSQVISAFWRFSPCGDQLMLFAQRSLNGSSSDEAQFFLLGPGTSAAPFERASLILPVQSGVGATVVPATASFGDFDVVLNGLTRIGGAPTLSYPCPQCRRRP